MEHNLPLNDERLLALREVEAAEHLTLRTAWKSVETAQLREARKKAQSRINREMLRRLGIEDEAPEVEVRDDEEARTIADSPLPGTENDPEWTAWEQQALDPTKDL